VRAREEGDERAGVDWGIVRDRSTGSFTADAACAARAHGAMQPDPALRNPDALASRLVGMPFRMMLWPLLRRRFVAAFEQRAPGVYFVHQARTKHLDAILLAELDAGASQLVVLGAGFDSRALRFAERLKGARVLEVDHPATSAEKQRRVTRAFGAAAGGVRYVAADFTRDDLGAQLAAGGFARDARTVFLWEGGSMYLTASAVEAILAFVAKAAPGSALAVDYLWRSALERPDEPTKRNLAATAARGEPYLFGLDPDEVAPLFARHALSIVSNVGADVLATRYLTGSDGAVWGRPLPYVGIAHARV
jgi:methyltransferase (TIGR00027 family)